jgi:hypothetical protein
MSSSGVKMPSGSPGCRRGPLYTQRIEAVPVANLRKIRPDPEEPDLRPPPSVDHDGIKLIDDGTGSSTVYKSGGQWRQVDASC